MLLMMLIMSLPFLGIALFLVLPLGEAVPAYVVVAGFSVFYQWLMAGAMHLPVRTGMEKMAGSIAAVRSWDGRTGLVMHDGEIWQAETEVKQSFARGEKVGIAQVNGLKLRVAPLAHGYSSVMATSQPFMPREVTK